VEDIRSSRAEAVDVPGSAKATQPRRRFNILAVGWRVLVALAILIGAGVVAQSMIQSRPEPPERRARERSFTVAAEMPVSGTFSPEIGAFGEVVAGRTIEVRSQVSGEAVAVSPNLAVGGVVTEGETLVSVDSFMYDGALRDAEALLADARLQLTVAEEQLEIERLNLETAEAQLALARSDLARARSLVETGSLNDKSVEDRQLVVSQREQAVAQSQSNIRVQQAAIARQETAIARAEWARDQARRSVENTQIKAPFDGVVMSESAELGRVISNNESITALYDRNALEVRFTLSDRQYGPLVRDGLIGRPVTVTWDIDPEPVTVSGSIVRAGAEIDAALGGVEIFAALETANTDLRPGTFVAVAVDGLAYEDALRLPETAIYENNHFYIIRDGRMARVDAELLARDGQFVIVRADVPEGERVITTRVAQAGEGLLVQVEGEEPPQTGPRGGGQRQGQSGERPAGQASGG